MSTKFVGLWAALFLSIATTNAHAISYDVDLIVGAGRVKGYINTDNTIGMLRSENILDWQVTLTSPNLGSGSPVVIGNTRVIVSSGGFTATATRLFHDFDVSGIVLFADIGPQPRDFFCFNGKFANCSHAGDRTISFGRGLGLETNAEFSFARGLISVAKISSVPLPAGLPLLLAGLGGLGLLSRVKLIG